MGLGSTRRVNLEIVHNDGAWRLFVLAHGFNCDVGICRELNCSWLIDVVTFHTHHTYNTHHKKMSSQIKARGVVLTCNWSYNDIGKGENCRRLQCVCAHNVSNACQRTPK